MARFALSSISFIFLSLLFGFTVKNDKVLLDGVVPPDLGKEVTTILVIETERNMVNEAFESVFSKYYSGTIEVIPISSLGSSKYKDIKKYRYFMQTSIRLIEASGMGISRVPATYEYSYKIIDREGGKEYGFDYGSDSWKNHLKKYVRKLEEMKKSNEGK